MEFTINITGLQEIIDRAIQAGANLDPLMTAATTKSTLDFQKEARLQAPHKTGTLQRSILATVDTSTSLSPVGTVNVNEKYGLYVEKGTGAHDIYPSKKKALFWAGAEYPVAVVHHPGTKANPFFARTIEVMQPIIKGYFQEVADSIVAQMAGK